MEKQLALLIFLIFCVYLFLDGMGGKQKYLDRFVLKLLPNNSTPISWDWKTVFPESRQPGEGYTQAKDR